MLDDKSVSRPTNIPSSNKRILSLNFVVLSSWRNPASRAVAVRGEPFLAAASAKVWELLGDGASLAIVSVDEVSAEPAAAGPSRSVVRSTTDAFAGVGAEKEDCGKKSETSELHGGYLGVDVKKLIWEDGVAICWRGVMMKEECLGLSLLIYLQLLTRRINARFCSLGQLIWVPLDVRRMCLLLQVLLHVPKSRRHPHELIPSLRRISYLQRTQRSLFDVRKDCLRHISELGYRGESFVFSPGMQCESIRPHPFQGCINVSGDILERRNMPKYVS